MLRLTIDEVIGFCKERLADYKLPREVVFRQDLPKTLTGKVQKKVLKEELLRFRSRLALFTTSALKRRAAGRKRSRLVDRAKTRL